ncbi:MAG: tetratricopeptide repeat protein [Planctomycetales bacterium]
MSNLDNLNGAGQKTSGDASSSTTRTADRLVQTGSEDGRAYEQTGLALSDDGDLIGCRLMLETAQVFVPLSAAAELALGECYVEANDAVDLAAGLLENVARREPAETGTLLRVASCFRKLGRDRDAWLTCRRAVRESPDEAQAWFDLSTYMGRVGFPFSKVEVVVQRAIDLEPNNVVFRISLAAALSKLGREHHAYAVIRRFDTNELKQICCSNCLESLRLLFEGADDWRGVRICNEQLVQRSISGTSECCGESED